MDFIHLIRFIDRHRIMFFSTAELAAHLGVEVQSIQSYLETLANNGLILRVEKGKYCRTFLRDRYVIGSHLIRDGVISHDTALQYFGLQPVESPEVFVSSCHQKRDKDLFGNRYRFIRIRPHKHFGHLDRRGPEGSFSITDPEKTLLDCFDQPRYTQGFQSLAEVFFEHKFDQKRLSGYGVRLNNLSVLKRMGYLIDKYQLPGYPRFRKTALQQVNERYSLLDPAGPNRGPFDSRWRIRDNTNDI
ncbi:MAG: type IV toxin-antitoxin system AbiEi family antitoxin [Bacteroidales bacterium]